MRNLCILVFTALLTTALLEIGCRFLEKRGLLFSKVLDESYSGHWLDTTNRIWEVWHVPKTAIVHQKTCFRAFYHSNSFGMRDKERQLQGTKPRIVLLGDSMTEGYGVNDEEAFPRLLEEDRFRGAAEFLNFGTSGNFGTTQEWLVYRHLARRFHPQFVIIFFLAENDVSDNSWTYWKTHASNRARPYFVPDGTGKLILSYPGGPEKASALSSLLDRSAAPRALGTAAASVRDSLVMDPRHNVYRTPPDSDWEIAWEATRKSLELLKADVEEDHARLFLVDLATPTEIDPEKTRAIERVHGFDVTYPHRRIQSIAEELGIGYFSMLPGFIEYRRTHALKPPYFSFECDVHWSPLGHRVAAQVLDPLFRELLAKLYRRFLRTSS